MFAISTMNHFNLMFENNKYNFEPSREKTNIVDSALSFDPDQPKHAAQAYPDRHFSPSVDFLFEESLLYTSIPLRREVSVWISLRVLRRLIWKIYYAEAILLVFSRDGSFVLIARLEIIKG